MGCRTGPEMEMKNQIETGGKSKNNEMKRENERNEMTKVEHKRREVHLSLRRNFHCEMKAKNVNNAFCYALHINSTLSENILLICFVLLLLLVFCFFFCAHSSRWYVCVPILSLILLLLLQCVHCTENVLLFCRL